MINALIDALDTAVCPMSTAMPTNRGYDPASNVCRYVCIYVGMNVHIGILELLHAVYMYVCTVYICMYV